MLPSWKELSDICIGISVTHLAFGNFWTAVIVAVVSFVFLVFSAVKRAMDEMDDGW